MSTRTITCVVLIAVGVLRAAAPARGAPQPFAAETVEKVAVRMLVEGGKLLVGANDIVVELSPSDSPPDAGDVVVVAAQAAAPGQSVSVGLSPDGAGRFSGTLTLPWTGRCRVEIAWHDAHGRHSHEFVVPVVAGHH
jgi:hypothetical protein